MKIALCFYGLVGSKTDKNGIGSSLDPAIAYKLNYENIIKFNTDLGNDVDVFIHSSSYEHKSTLIELYNPKSYSIEKQKEFPQSKGIASNRSFFELAKIAFSRVRKPWAISNSIKKNRKEAFRACSRWYSNKKVIELKAMYEKDNKFEYDCVMALRLDVGFYNNLDFSSYDMSYFYASHWNDCPNSNNNFKSNFVNHHQGKGFLDFWFFSNSSYMNHFANLYDNISNYHVIPHRSAYEHTKTFTNKIKYTKYRWSDFEMIRRKEFKADK
jgi:hypothetical protein